jgi:hypothetical protein
MEEAVNISVFGMSGPLVDRFTIEAPVATQLEGGQLSLFHEAVDRRRMYAQIACDFFQL